jgi:hypothetical protein
MRDLKESYDKCLAEGTIIKLHGAVNSEKVRKMLLLVESNKTVAQKSAEDANEKSVTWNTIYNLHYDVLRELVEAFLVFDFVKIINHKCLFAYLCIKHPDLDFNWEFFEKIRRNRNGINYYGQLVSYEDFKDVEMQLNLYVSTLKKEIEKKLSSVSKEKAE